MNPGGAGSLRVAVGQINFTVGDLSGNVVKAKAALTEAEAASADVVVFPELAITGYPPEDLVFRPGFVSAVRSYLDDFAAHTGQCAAVIGFVDGAGESARDVPDMADAGAAYNSVAVCADGRVRGVYHKRHLPNYDVFDEVRNFRPGQGESPALFEIAGAVVGITVCEDAWVPDGPLQELADNGAQLVINVSSSPFREGKQSAREKLMGQRALLAGVPMLYVNLVGGQDSLVFDGSSFVVNESGVVTARCGSFTECVAIFDLELLPRRPTNASVVPVTSPQGTTTGVLGAATGVVGAVFGDETSSAAMGLDVGDEASSVASAGFDGAAVGVVDVGDEASSVAGAGFDGAAVGVVGAGVDVGDETSGTASGTGVAGAVVGDEASGAAMGVVGAEASGDREQTTGPDSGIAAPLIETMSINEQRWGALVLGTGDYVRKSGFSDVLVGLSGGVDSSLVAAVAVDALGADHVHGVLLPSRYTSKQSCADAEKLAANLGISTCTIEINPAHMAVAQILEASITSSKTAVGELDVGTGVDGLTASDKAVGDTADRGTDVGTSGDGFVAGGKAVGTGDIELAGGTADSCTTASELAGVGIAVGSLTDQNIQSRLRGLTLMALANEHGWLVLTTGNKSEMAVGYSTLYGDTAGAYAVISDVWKLTVYELCRWRNRQAGHELIPANVLAKAPSAELAPGQRDDQSLPAYEVLDPILRLYVEEFRSVAEIQALGLAPPEEVARVCHLVDIAEYKRRQSPLGPRITGRAFGRDRRMPIVNRYR